MKRTVREAEVMVATPDAEPAAAGEDDDQDTEKDTEEEPVDDVITPRAAVPRTKSGE